MSKVVNVLPVNKAQIPDDSKFLIKEVEGCKYPLYIEKHLGHIWEKSEIDVAGWSSFRRLVLIDA